MNVKELFEKHEDEFLKFDRVTNKNSGRRDLHAFILLDKLVPADKGDIVCSAEHDEIWLDVNVPDLEASNVTEEQIMELIRCGIRLDGDMLAMFA